MSIPTILTDPRIFDEKDKPKSWRYRLSHAVRIPGLTLRRSWLMAQILFSLCTFSTFFITTPFQATIMTSLIGVSWSLTLWAPFALISGEIAQRAEAKRRRQRESLLNSVEEEDDDKAVTDDEEEEDQAGIILGLHNVAISSPQVIATLLSSAIFQVLQKPRNVPGDVSVQWTLRMGGLATLVSAFITWKMGEPKKVDQ
jgi:solute carrier family 45 protein 1/2/4